MKFALITVFFFAAVGMAAPAADVVERSAVAEPIAEPAEELTVLMKRQQCTACVGGQRSCFYCWNGGCTTNKYKC